MFNNGLHVVVIKFTCCVIVDLFSSVAGEDYNLVPSPAVLVFFPTTTTEGVQSCLYFAIIDDTALEGNHSFTVNISSTSPDISRGSPSEADVVIADNES